MFASLSSGTSAPAGGAATAEGAATFGTRPGDPYPLGATFDGLGTNFAVFSEVAESVDLCLFDEDGREERVPLVERDAMVWHGYVPAVSPGQNSNSVWIRCMRSVAPSSSGLSGGKEGAA